MASTERIALRQITPGGITPVGGARASLPDAGARSGTRHEAGVKLQQAGIRLAAPFVGGPLYRSQALLRLIGPGRPNTVPRAVLAMALCWLPLALLSAVHAQSMVSFWMDFAAHARYLVLVPLLIVAEGVCLPRMSALACNFRLAGLVVDADHHRFIAATVSTRRLLNARWAEAAVVMLAYLATVVAFFRLSGDLLPAWVLVPASPEASAPVLSPAGWWGLLVSVPVTLALLLGWAWRLGLWARFLWLMSRLELRLVPVHPDGAAGLGFVGYSARAFTVLAVALGALAAGTVANEINAGATLESYYHFVGAYVAAVVVLLNAPQLVFFGNLLEAWRRGTMEYSVLADRFGREFERKWFSRTARFDEGVLERQDFSAATDLYQVVDRVYSMRLFPLHIRSIVTQAAATLLPFLPVTLMAVPFDDVVSRLAGLFL
jgi:hypothetical protein